MISDGEDAACPSRGEFDFKGGLLIRGGEGHLGRKQPAQADCKDGFKKRPSPSPGT